MIIKYFFCILYDFYHINRTYFCQAEMGLSDGQPVEHDEEDGRQDEGLQLDPEAWHHHEAGYTLVTHSLIHSFTQPVIHSFM